MEIFDSSKLTTKREIVMESMTSSSSNKIISSSSSAYGPSSGEANVEVHSYLSKDETSVTQINQQPVEEVSLRVFLI